MQLDPSEDQIMMTDMFARFLDGESSIARVREAILAGGFDSGLWRGLAEQGALSIRVPEAAGGLGLGLFDAALLMEQAGRTLVSGPLAEAIVAARLLALLDPDDATGLRAGIASGASVVTLALQDVAVEPEQLVAGGAVAGAVVARDGDTVVLVRPGGQQVERTLASTPLARLTLSGGERIVLGRGNQAIALHAAAVEEWKLLIAAALAGLSAEAVRIASAYACERVQFGRPIGSYQGVSHPLADAIVEVDAGRLMLWRAIRAVVDGDADAGERVSIAAWWAGQASEKAVVRSLHTHGGYGLTLEYDIHLFNLRSRAWLLVLGDPELLLEEAARRRYGRETTHLPDAGTMSVEYGLGDEAEALAQETRNFFEATLTPELRAKAHYSYAGHDPGVHKKLAEAGLLYPDWPERIGGRGVSTYAMQAAHKVWEDYDWTSHPHGTTNIIGLMIDRFGTDQCKADILSRIITGDIICSLGYSEPGSGSDVFAAKTRATRQVDGSWRIDGQKMFTSGAEHGDYVIMLARTDPEAPKHKGVSMFMVPLRVPGVTIQEVRTFQDERTNITYYDGVVIPDAYRLGEINGGLAVMSLALEIEQGMSFGPYQERLVHAAERLCGKAMRQGRPAIEDTAVQRRLTKVWANAIASQCLHDRILWVTAEGRQNLAYGPAVKMFSAEAYRADAFDLLGLTAPESLAFADKDAAFINQCYRHSQVATVYGGTSEVQRSQVAEKQLGLPRTRQRKGGGIVPPMICAPDMDNRRRGAINDANRQQGEARMSSDSDIVVERLGQVARFTLNRPAQMNAFTLDMTIALPRLMQAEIDAGARAIILTGAGGNFSSGADIAPAGVGTGQIDVRARMEDCYNPLARFLMELPVPLVTAINGAAAGGGASLALAGDIVVAGRSSYVMLAFVRRGLVPDVGVTWLVASAVGRLRAMKMALLGDKMPAEEALAAGLVSEVVDDDQVMARAEEIAARLAEMPTRTLAMIRSQVNVAVNAGFEASLDAERDNQVAVTKTRDFKEGIAAFKEKRKPVFTGE